MVLENWRPIAAVTTTGDVVPKRKPYRLCLADPALTPEAVYPNK